MIQALRASEPQAPGILLRKPMLRLSEPQHEPQAASGSQFDIAHTLKADVAYV